ncbi:hypothetical protein G6F68_016112 [Rhizopus microsporus]|nr:hypothetical protein G6F68_016112 [Rhizopus microsporus]
MAVRAVAYGIDRHDADQVGLGQQARGQRKLVDRQHGVALVAVGGQFVVNQGGSAQQADNQVPGAQEVIQRKARPREQRMALAHRAHFEYTPAAMSTSPLSRSAAVLSSE